MIIGCNGPLAIDPETKVLLFESVLFDRSKSAASKDSERISLENRWKFTRNPSSYLDNLVGSLDALEHELKSLEGKWLVCLHSNDLLLTSSNKELFSRFKSIVTNQEPNIKIVLSISVPGTISDETQGTEYLLSHIHYGIQNGSLLFGMLGPMVIDSDTSESQVRMYVNAQQKSGSPVLTVQVKDSNRFQALAKSIDFNWNKTVIFGIKSAANLKDISQEITIGLTVNPADLVASGNTDGAPPDLFSTVISTGVECKTDMKKFGGEGIDFCYRYYDWKDLESATSRALSLLNFDWNPPMLNVVVEDESAKWVCDICGLTARLNEKENYTKHGYTYCSIACLGEHRKRGFK
jgi:hypothetical protein